MSYIHAYMSYSQIFFLQILTPGARHWIILILCNVLYPQSFLLNPFFLSLTLEQLHVLSLLSKWCKTSSKKLKVFFSRLKIVTVFLCSILFEKKIVATFCKRMFSVLNYLLEQFGRYQGGSGSTSSSLESVSMKTQTNLFS